MIWKIMYGVSLYLNDREVKKESIVNLISKRGMLKLTTNYSLFTFIVLFIFGCQSNIENEQEASTERPNVIFIMTDDHSKRAMSAYTDELMQTPHLDQLSRESVNFSKQVICPIAVTLITNIAEHLADSVVASE